MRQNSKSTDASGETAVKSISDDSAYAVMTDVVRDCYNQISMEHRDRVRNCACQSATTVGLNACQCHARTTRGKLYLTKRETMYLVSVIFISVTSSIVVSIVVNKTTAVTPIKPSQSENTETTTKTLEMQHEELKMERLCFDCALLRAYIDEWAWNGDVTENVPLDECCFDDYLTLLRTFKFYTDVKVSNLQSGEFFFPDLKHIFSNNLFGEKIKKDFKLTDVGSNCNQITIQFSNDRQRLKSIEFYSKLLRGASSFRTSSNEISFASTYKLDAFLPYLLSEIRKTSHDLRQIHNAIQNISQSSRKAPNETVTPQILYRIPDEIRELVESMATKKRSILYVKSDGLVKSEAHQYMSLISWSSSKLFFPIIQGNLELLDTKSGILHKETGYYSIRVEIKFKAHLQENQTQTTDLCYYLKYLPEHGNHITLETFSKKFTFSEDWPEYAGVVYKVTKLRKGDRVEVHVPRDDSFVSRALGAHSISVIEES